jgi:hypothetical protein
MYKSRQKLEYILKANAIMTIHLFLIKTGQGSTRDFRTKDALRLKVRDKHFKGNQILLHRVSYEFKDYQIYVNCEIHNLDLCFHNTSRFSSTNS